MIVFLSSKSLVSECTSTEKWYGTKYLDEPLDEDLVNRSTNQKI